VSVLILIPFDVDLEVCCRKVRSCFTVEKGGHVLLLWFAINLVPTVHCVPSVKHVWFK
jgi:hypothetical protein